MCAQLCSVLGEGAKYSPGNSAASFYAHGREYLLTGKHSDGHVNQQNVTLTHYRYDLS